MITTIETDSKNTTLNGLTEAQVLERRRKFGENILPALSKNIKPKTPTWL
jgi:hypothetical protein